MEHLFRHQLDTDQAGVLVEKKAFLSSKNIELHFYETIAEAYNVAMSFDLPVIAVMVRGEKIVEMEELGTFQYHSGESLIIPTGTELIIDFPSASLENPTHCLAFLPDESLIEEALYDFYQNTNQSDVQLNNDIDMSTDLLMRDKAILQTVNYLLYLFGEKNEHSDLFINQTTKELVIRVLQSKARKAFLNSFHKKESRMNHIARYIKKNLSNSISVQELSQEANMSQSNFFNLFKNTFGLTPNDYIIQQKIDLAKKIIQKSKDKSISQIAYELGYANSSYFSKQFKNITGMTPRQYEKSSD